MDKIRVLLADDQTLITQSFKIVLETTTDDIQVVGTAKNGFEVLDFLKISPVDVILMDVRMPDMDGVEAARLVRRDHPVVQVIMLTTFDDDNYVKSALQYGVAGYLLKDISTDELVNAVRAAMRGPVLLSPKVAERISSGSRQEELRSLASELSRREIEILRLVARGFENKDIAESLSMAEQSVKNTLSRIYLKIGVENRKEARRVAWELGICRPDEAFRP
jgi:DNA-binding NarL/FixJ family response regulator